MDPAAVDYEAFDESLGLPFPPRKFNITPKQTGDVRIELVDNNRIIIANQLDIAGDGNYNTNNGRLHTCLRKPVVPPLFTLSINQG